MFNGSPVFGLCFCGFRDGVVVRALPFHQCGALRHMWIEFVGSLFYTERFFSVYSGFSLSSETNSVDLLISLSSDPNQCSSARRLDTFIKFLSFPFLWCPWVASQNSSCVFFPSQFGLFRIVRVEKERTRLHGNNLSFFSKSLLSF